MACIKIADSLIPANTNVPFDARTRVSTETDILNIENPAIGMTVYVEETGITYIIKSLKAGKAGILTIQNKLVDKYEKFIPTKLSELEQDISIGGTSENFEEKDPVYLADKPNIALKSEIPTKLSQLEQDIQIGGITEETDPTVPDWAKASTKPTYKWSEIQEKPALFSGSYNDLSNKPDIPSINGLATENYVNQSVENKADFSDIPTKIGQLINDKEFVSREECLALIQEALANFSPSTPSNTPAASLSLTSGTLVIADNNPLDQFSPHIEDDVLVLDDPNNPLDDFTSVENGTAII